MKKAEGFALVASMPMRFNGLVVETTNRCNARCEMCYQSAGPEGSDILGAARLDFNVLSRCIREARSIPTLAPRLHLAGGEAFIHFDECLALFRIASENGYLDVTGTTNAYWASNPKRAATGAVALRSSGVTSIEISWDFWHQPYIPAKTIGYCLQACRDQDIETNLRILTTRSHGLAEAIETLPNQAIAAAHRITSGPVFATGRAAKQILKDDFHKPPNGYSGACHSALNLTVNSFGNVFPCCAGFDQTNHYIVGNINDESIIVISERINRDPVMRSVVFRGAESLLPMLRASGIDLGEDFNNMCHLCWTIFSSEECAAAIKARVEAASRRAINRMLESLVAEEANND